MKIEITCDCGEKIEVSESELSLYDITPCSCGCCRGERLKVWFATCPKCKKELAVEQEQ